MMSKKLENAACWLKFMALAHSLQSVFCHSEGLLRM